MELLDVIVSVIILPIGTAAISFVVFRRKMTEKIAFIENTEKIIEMAVYLSLSSLIILAFLLLFNILYCFVPDRWLGWLLGGFGISLFAFSISNLSINSIPQAYIRTKVKECNKKNGLKTLEKVRTDIQWKFDDLLGGGMPLGHICLITGPPGVGISILGFEILFNGAKFRKEGGLFISMNEPKYLLMNRLNSVWKEIDKIELINFEEITGNSPPYPHINWKRIFERKISPFSWEYPIYTLLRKRDIDSNIKRVVIDLPPFYEWVSKEQIINFFDTLSRIAYASNLLVVVTCRTCESSLEQLAPTVINLRKKVLNDGRAVSTLTIKKNFGFPSSPVEYEFEIRGLELEKRNLAYKLKGLLFDERKGYEPFNESIPGIWIFETSFKVGEKLHEKMG